MKDGVGGEGGNHFQHEITKYKTSWLVSGVRLKGGQHIWRESLLTRP